MVDFSYEDKLEAIEREIKLRRRVYVNRIATGRMKPKFAEAQIAVMEAIRDDYRFLVEKERLI